MLKTSLALRNLRGVVILLILAFHSFVAYLAAQPAAPFAFDRAPYAWRGYPIVDSDRWIGFDLFCAFQFLYLMQLVFFLSGLFVWSSLSRRGCLSFLTRRIWRLGVPFVVGVYLLMPLAFFPVYRVTAARSELVGVSVALGGSANHTFRPAMVPVVTDGSRCCQRCALRAFFPKTRFVDFPFRSRPVTAARFFLLVILVSATAYLPLSAIYLPWQYSGFGPFEIQPSLAPQYVIYFFAGVVVGALEYERETLDLDIMLARRWRLLLLGTLASFALWIGPTALIVNGQDSNAALHIMASVGFVLFAATACFSAFALAFRFAAGRWPILDHIYPTMPTGFISFIILSSCGCSTCFLASLFPPLPRAWPCWLPR